MLFWMFNNDSWWLFQLILCCHGSCMVLNVLIFIPYSGLIWSQFWRSSFSQQMFFPRTEFFWFFFGFWRNCPLNGLLQTKGIMQRHGYFSHLMLPKCIFSDFEFVLLFIMSFILFALSLLAPLSFYPLSSVFPFFCFLGGGVEGAIAVSWVSSVLFLEFNCVFSWWNMWEILSDYQFALWCFSRDKYYYILALGICII